MQKTAIRRLVNTEASIGREGIRFLIQRKTGQVATVKMTAQSKGPKKGRRMFKQANPKKTSATPTAIRWSIGS
jgi:hypothetical protein